MTSDLKQDDLRRHDREALSALFDGELRGDAARFALKRLEHDEEWRDALERWQMAGDALRGQAPVVLPPEFAARVSAAIAGDVATPGTRGHVRRTRWMGGAALAASLAAVVLFMAQRTAPDGVPASQSVMVAVPPSKPVVSPPAAPPVATGAVRPVVASAEQVEPRQVPEPSTARRRPAPPAARAEAVAGVSPRPSDPFTPVDPPVSRPWPRAVLPQYDSGLTAGFGAPPSNPFEPRMPTDDGQGRNDDAPSR